MDCREARLLISRGIDGELADAPRPGLDEHVKECPDCAAYMRQCHALQGLIGRCGPVRTPVGRPLSVGRGSPFCRLAALVLATASVAVLCLWLAERSTSGRLRTALARQAAGQAAAGGQLPMGPVLASVGLDTAPPTEYVRAFQALGDYFQGDMQWVALDGPQMELGVAGYPGAGQAAERREAAVLCVRVVVAEPGAEPRVVSSPTVLLRPGAQAEFRFAEAEGVPAGHLAYRCAYEGEPDGVVSVGLTLQDAHAGRPVYLWGAVRTDGDGRTPAAFARVGSAQYMLFLAASPLLERDVPDEQA